MRRIHRTKGMLSSPLSLTPQTTDYSSNVCSFFCILPSFSKCQVLQVIYVFLHVYHLHSDSKINYLIFPIIPRFIITTVHFSLVNSPFTALIQHLILNFKQNVAQSAGSFSGIGNKKLHFWIRNENCTGILCNSPGSLLPVDETHSSWQDWDVILSSTPVLGLEREEKYLKWK